MTGRSLYWSERDKALSWSASEVGGRQMGLFNRNRPEPAEPSEPPEPPGRPSTADRMALAQQKMAQAMERRGQVEAMQSQPRRPSQHAAASHQPRVFQQGAAGKKKAPAQDP